MARVSEIDGVRGAFVLSMVTSHLVFSGGFWLDALNPKHFVFADSALGFVFISGIVYGMFACSVIGKKGRRFLLRHAAKRVGVIWAASVAAAALAYAVSLSLPDGQVVMRNWIGDSPPYEAPRLIAITLMMFQPTFCDILPLYAVFMIFAPFAAIACAGGRRWMVIVTSLTVWCFAQTDLSDRVLDPFSGLMTASDGKSLRAAFSPMGWQLLFFSGLVIGFWFRERGAARDVFSGQWPKLLMTSCVVVLLLLMPLRVAAIHLSLPDFMHAFFRVAENRRDVGPLMILSFFCASYGVAWLMCSEDSPARRFMSKIFSFPLLTLLGRNALLSYVWHVPLVYLAHYANEMAQDADGYVSLSWRSAAGAIVLALLFVPAAISESGGLRRR